ncbi:tryptophan halogenase family protein [Pseudoalteromonas sp. SSM20]|uniref:tryptophan halogenase family protein n=1 Tax=Pseudoalteromonas sp. SSM20 TaxID=3139394 RepID=UPI003BAB4443
MQTKPIQSIIILGGGTAGWLAANHLAINLKPKEQQGVKITVIESPDNPTIGVGEGTVPLMRNTLKEFGISEEQFIKECDVSFKQGIQFDNWMKPVDGKIHSYYHPFDYPILDNDSVAAWLQNPEIPFSHAMSRQALLCDNHKSPKAITDPEFAGQAAYGYHLDAYKFSDLLKHHAIENLGVEHLVSHIEDVTLTNNGEINSLISLQGDVFNADFYLDCSGFCSRLLGQALNIPFIEKSDVLFVDKALAIQVPYDSEQPKLPSSTIATACDAGWIWDIALPTRRGIGHVFSSKHCTLDEAKATLANYLNTSVDEINPRLIDMKIGHREKFWHKNCVAIGLSQGFVEPLEATGLLAFDATAKLLAKSFPTNTAQLAQAEKRYNNYVSGLWQGVINFIKMHYAVSDRDDTAFWRDNRDTASWPLELQEKLEHWRTHIPSLYDFERGFDAFRLENYLYVLYGMNYPTKIGDTAYRYQAPDIAQKQFDLIQRQATQVADYLEDNLTVINKIKQFGLSKV